MSDLQTFLVEDFVGQISRFPSCLKAGLDELPCCLLAFSRLDTRVDNPTPRKPKYVVPIFRSFECAIDMTVIATYGICIEFHDANYSPIIGLGTRNSM